MFHDEKWKQVEFEWFLSLNQSHWDSSRYEISIYHNNTFGKDCKFGQVDDKRPVPVDFWFHVVKIEYEDDERPGCDSE